MSDCVCGEVCDQIACEAQPGPSSWAGVHQTSLNGFKQKKQKLNWISCQLTGLPESPKNVIKESVYKEKLYPKQTPQLQTPPNGGDDHLKGFMIGYSFSKIKQIILQIALTWASAWILKYRKFLENQPKKGRYLKRIRFLCICLFYLLMRIYSLYFHLKV